MGKKLLKDITIVYVAIVSIVFIGLYVVAPYLPINIYARNIIFALIQFVVVLSLIKILNGNLVKYYGSMQNKKMNLLGILALVLAGGTVISLAFLKVNRDEILFRVIFLLVVALTEEYYFRGYFHTRLVEYFGEDEKAMVKVVLIQSMLFMLAHVPANIMQGRSVFVYASQFAIAVGLTLLRIKTRNITIPIAVHWVINIL